ncbi:MAG: aminoacyl-tRNA hydrolase [Chloroflexi bacterium RBG_16_50_9]|nr:MAG: aminoacyl-tRNA hydrolase [Chloroflexi bacterium RBG_16_50_9]
MKLIVGLGNPGLFYAHNRHNIGFMCVSHLARTQGIHFDKKKGNARIGTSRIAGEEVVLARPQAYMNASGASVKKLLNKFNIRPPDIIIIHDDLDLAIGKIRIRLGSSSGGHKGIESIIANLDTHDFYRIRVGIGRPDVPGGLADDKEAAVIDYVLSDFTPEEKNIISQVIPRVSQAVNCLLTEGLAAAMNKYNRDLKQDAT